jgi:ElaB/YqjD/DUF883 family membrane-anchored ribosome-binding protein
MNRLEDANSRLRDDVRTLVSDVDEMLGALQLASAGSIEDARKRYDAAVLRARIRLARTRAATKAGAMRVAGDAELFAHQHPWRTAGMAFATGLVLGALIGVASASGRR